MSTARLISTALALVLGVFSARYFGASAAKDCYLVAQTIPALIMTFLTGGVYSSLLITLMEIGRREGIAGQVSFTRRTLWHLTLLLVPCLMAVALFPRALIGLIAPGFGEDRLVLSARLLPLTTLTAMVAIYFTIVRCLYQTRSQFVLPSFVYLIIPVLSVVTLVTFVGRAGIFALAAGPFLGNVLAVVILVLLVRPLLRDPQDFVLDPISAAERSAQQRGFWAALLPMSIAANCGQINLLIDNAFGSFLPTGAITLLGFAFVIVSNAELLTTLSLAEVAFPRLSAAALRGSEDLRDTLRWNQRHMVLLTAPLAAGALALGTPLVRLLFQRGEFGAESTAGVARLLACFAPEIFFMGYLVLFSRVLFARRRYTLVSWIATAAILANATLDYLLVKPLGVYGIALATTLVSCLHMLMLAPLVRREVPAMHALWDSGFAAKVVASSAVMALLVLAWTFIFERAFDASHEAARLAEVGIGLAFGGATYVTLLHALHIEEARAVVKRLLGSVALLASP